MAVLPVYRLLPVKVRVPAPALFKAPVVLAAAPETVRLAVETSMLPVPAAASVKPRSMLTLAPV